MTVAMRRWSFFNAELTRSTLVDDGSGHGLAGATGRLDHVTGVGGGDFDGLQGAADGVLVRGCALGQLLLYHAHLHLHDLEGVVELHVAEFLRFTAALITVRRRIAQLLDLPDDAGLLDLLDDARIEWNGVRVGEPDLGDDSHSVSLMLRADAGALQIIFNAYWEPLEFELGTPDVDVDGWRRIVDTSLVSPDDIAVDRESAARVDGSTYLAGPRSVVVLAARRSPDGSPRRRTK